MATLRCINCSLRVARIRRHRLSQESDEIMERVKRWVYPRDISGADFLCHACWELVSGHIEPPPVPTSGHRSICITCGRSILRIRSRTVLRPNMSEREMLLQNIIAEWIHPRQLQPSDEVCIPCWLRGQRVADTRNQGEIPSQQNENVEMSAGPSHEQYNEQVFPDSELHSQQNEEVEMSAGPSHEQHNEQAFPDSELHSQQNEEVEMSVGPSDTPNIHQQQSVNPESDEQVPLHGDSNEAEPTITLPTVRRAAATSRCCLFPVCDDRDRRSVPDTIRRRIIMDYNFYIPISARICNYHLQSNTYHELYAADNALSTFKASHIEDIVFLLKDQTQLDFLQPDDMDDHLFRYWFGRTKSEYNSILAEVPRLNNPKMKMGFSAVLCKMRTGDSDERIAALFQTPRRTLETYIKQARDILCQGYVPLHLGLNHITREEAVARNSYLANNLFGNPEEPIGNRNLITIADGTYLNTQKSSNYAFQKNTYSLHKYHNLVKPFLIVCCDGYIIDALGPYPATKNDAEIMKEFIEHESLFNIFKEDDIFILDRGFRDCRDDLFQKGFQVHMPETIEDGERQLSTLQANITRCITMNRWVVEAVNGRFSRDFKIFRADFLNKRCPPIMQEFTIAAALINHFATQFSERENVQAILNIRQENIFKDNMLGQIIQDNNLNMRYRMFHSITRSNLVFPELNMEDLQLIALGTYQIRQAKSYVGEHLRSGGIYMIEVCRDDFNNNEIVSAFGGINPYLLRARIKSRYVGSRSYYTYLVVDRGLEGYQGILGYYCHCAAGKRTVGCCSHTMSILWYMGYASRQGYIEGPASFLDRVLIT